MGINYDPGYPEEYDFDIVEASEKVIKRAEKHLKRLFEENDKSMPTTTEEIIGELSGLLELAIKEIKTR